MFNLRLTLVVMGLSCMFVAGLTAQRDLAPGVLKVIPPLIDARDSHSNPMPLPGVEAVPYESSFFPKSETLHGLSEQVIFNRDVWQYEFAFIGLRQMTINMQVAENGPVEPRNVWYMVYRIRNTGAALGHRVVEDETYGLTNHELVRDPETVDPVTLPNRFFGDMTLEGWIYDEASGDYVEKSYSERVVPAIVPLIQQEEDSDRPLLDKIQLAAREMAKVPADADGGGHWAVAVWLDVDPTLDFLSIKISGLTNAYRVHYSTAGEKSIVYKTLRLNFWRPGDRFEQTRDRIVFGVPLVDSTVEQSELAVRYKMPGPLLRGEQLIDATQRRVLLFESDAELSPRKLNSIVANQLDRGELPAGLELAFRGSGVTLGADYAVEQRATGNYWQVTDTAGDGESRTFLLRLNPIFWDKKPGGGLRFLERVDHFWYYE